MLTWVIKWEVYYWFLVYFVFANKQTKQQIVTNKKYFDILIVIAGILLSEGDLMGSIRDIP
jgi:hypothetical protein